MKDVLIDLLADESAGSMVEYGVIAALLAAPSIAILAAIANKCGTTLTNTANGLTSIAQTNP